MRTAINSGMPQIAAMQLKSMKGVDKDPQYWYYLGTASKDMGKYDDAVAAFMNGLRLNDKNGGILDGLGVVYAKKDDYARAVEFLRKAVELEPTNARYYNDLGLVYLLMKDPDMAMKAFTTSFKLSQSKDTMKNLASVYGMKGDYKKAREILMESFPLHEVYYLLGQAYELNRDTDQAVELYKMSVVANREFKPAREKLITMGISGDEI
ncbi:MAG: tetratricopeptide repeat protein [Nitrospirales bacterium]|nr:tetratricopeptide repeat protein [Nitrospirales bacterium]